MEDRYALEYLPLAAQDLRDIVQYLAQRLDAPGAAAAFLDALEEAAGRLRRFPYAQRVYPTQRPLQDEIRMLPVKHYAVFYVVHEEDKTVEVRRVVYARRDLQALL